MTDIVKRLVALANSLGGADEDDIMAGVAEIERLRGTLGLIEVRAANILRDIHAALETKL